MGCRSTEITKVIVVLQAFSADATKRFLSPVEQEENEQEGCYAAEKYCQVNVADKG
ncbi:hypothetical protein KDA_60980 [Dictyobacter alpinus]|uniref:Uncharacterized protein n=1 Tax=Dictyobacter alpinus TaxID=2014873 RepID=A0A402BGR3_9CHLR|nr:hypothetical protein KDA_60980 [Dictyobacter alpinus]